MNDVISMANKANDGTLQSPEQALEESLTCIGQSGAFKKGKKLLVLALDEAEGDYHISFVQAGMKMSECISLCEIAKTLFLTEMEYI